MQKYKCTICGYVYDPAQGDPANGVKPGTSFETFLRTGRVLSAAPPKTSSSPSDPGGRV